MELLGKYYDPEGDDMAVLKGRARKLVELYESSDPFDYTFSCIRDGILTDSEEEYGSKLVIARSMVRDAESGLVYLHCREDWDGGKQGREAMVMIVSSIEITADALMTVYGRTRNSIDSEPDAYTSEYVYRIRSEGYDTGIMARRNLPAPDPLLNRLYYYLVQMRIRQVLDPSVWMSMCYLRIAMDHGKKAEDIIGMRAVQMMRSCYLSQQEKDWRGWEDWYIPYNQYHKDIIEMEEITRSRDEPRRMAQMRLDDY